MSDVTFGTAHRPGLISYQAPTPPILLLSMIAALLAVCPSARAGQYVWNTTNPAAESPTFSGCRLACTNNGSPESDGSIGYSGITYGYGADFKPTNGSITCNGTFSAMFNWQAVFTGEMPPASAILTETCAAHCSSATPGGTASASDGFGDTTAGGSVSHTFYSEQPGAQTITGPSRSPAASVTDTQKTELIAGVTYTASAAPVTISMGGATSDGNGGYDILVGQQCHLTLSGIPSACAVSNYQWSVTGTTFQSWTVSADQSHITEVDGPGPLNGPNPSSTPRFLAPVGTGMTRI